IVDPFDVGIGFRASTGTGVESENFYAGLSLQLLRDPRILRAVNEHLRLFLLDLLRELHQMVRCRLDPWLELDAADPLKAKGVGQINPARNFFPLFLRGAGGWHFFPSD